MLDLPVFDRCLANCSTSLKRFPISKLNNLEFLLGAPFAPHVSQASSVSEETLPSERDPQKDKQPRQGDTTCKKLDGLNG